MSKLPTMAQIYPSYKHFKWPKTDDKNQVLTFACALAYEPNVALEYPPELFCLPGSQNMEFWCYPCKSVKKWHVGFLFYFFHVFLVPVFFGIAWIVCFSEQQLCNMITTMIILEVINMFAPNLAEKKLCPCVFNGFGSRKCWSRSLCFDRQIMWFSLKIISAIDSKWHTQNLSATRSKWFVLDILDVVHSGRWNPVPETFFSI